MRNCKVFEDNGIELNIILIKKEKKSQRTRKDYTISEQAIQAFFQRPHNLSVTKLEVVFVIYVFYFEL